MDYTNTYPRKNPNDTLNPKNGPEMVETRGWMVGGEWNWELGMR